MKSNATRFWEKVEKTDTCWNWAAYKRADGYGEFWLNGQSRYAHRVAYELEVGEIPEGLTIDHLCRNTSCVNPSHLEPVTHAENVRRGDAGWRNAIKTHCPHGHPYDEANTYVNPDGRRDCRACHRDRTLRRYRENRVAS